MKLLLLILMRIGFCLDCKDDAGRSVDFWLILKLPKNDEKKLSGWEYLYCDSNDQCVNLSQKKDKLGDGKSPLEKTVEQLKIDKSAASYDQEEVTVIWSDQPYPKFSNGNKAHSKGIMTVSSKSGDGFIINHSLPNYPVFDKFPGIKIMPGMPPTGPRYAQHFFCVSLKIDQIEKLAKQYKIAEIMIRLSQFPDTNDPLKKHGFDYYPHILSLAKEEGVEENWGKDTISSKGGLEIQVFSTSEGIENREIVVIGEKSSKREATSTPDSEVSSKKARDSTSVLKILSRNKKNQNKKHHLKQQVSFLFTHETNNLILQGTVDVKYQGFFARIVAPSLQQNIIMSTWGKGTPKLQDPVCDGKYQSLSTKYRKHAIIVDGETVQYKFKYTKDHSKIGISFPKIKATTESEVDTSVGVYDNIDDDEDYDNKDPRDDSKYDFLDSNFQNWIIVADLNRQLQQTSRGGTALCFKHVNLWKILHQSFRNRQECK